MGGGSPKPPVDARCPIVSLLGGWTEHRTGNRIDGAMCCPTWCILMHPLFCFLCDVLSSHPVLLVLDTNHKRAWSSFAWWMSQCYFCWWWRLRCGVGVRSSSLIDAPLRTEERDNENRIYRSLAAIWNSDSSSVPPSAAALVIHFATWTLVSFGGWWITTHSKLFPVSWSVNRPRRKLAARRWIHAAQLSE